MITSDELGAENESLRRRLAEAEAALENAPDIIVRFDRQCRHLYVNRAIGPATGRAPQEFIGKTNEELGMPPDLCGRWRNTVESVFHSATPHAMEFTFPAPEGPRHYNLRAVPEFRESGEVETVLCVTRDVTTQRNVEEALHQSELKFATLFNHSPNFKFVTEAETMGFVEVNDAWSKLTGYGYQELIGRSPADLGIFPAAAVQKLLSLVRACGRAQNQEVILTTKSGDSRTVLLSLEQLSLVPGNPIIASGTDISDRKQAEERVRRSRKAVTELVERAPFGIYVVDSQFRIAQMNAGSQSGAFRNVKPVIGRDFAEAIGILWPEPVAREVIDAFRRTLDTGEPYSSRNFVKLRQDVETVEAYEWELHRVTLPDGECGVVCYFYDSTRLRETEAALQRQRTLLEGISRILREAISARTEEELGAVCLEVAKELTQSGMAFIGEVNSLTGKLDGVAISTPEPEKGQTALPAAALPCIPVELPLRGVFAQVMRGGKALSINQPELGMDSLATPDAPLPLRSFLGVPLIQEGRATGMFALGNRPGGFTDVEQKTVEALAPVILQAFGRKRTETALRESEERLRLAKAAAQLGIHDHDLRTGHIQWDERLRELWGLEPGEAVTHDVFLAGLHPDDRAAVQAALDRALDPAGSRRFSAIFRVIGRPSKDTPFWVEMMGQVYFKGNQPVRSVGTVLDVTERRQAEEELIWLASFPNLNPNPIVEIELASGALKFVNATAEALFPDLIRDGIAHPFLAGAHQVAQDLLAHNFPFVREVAVDKQYYHQNWKLTPDRTRLRVYGMDITERRRAESALRWSARRNEVLSQTAARLLESGDPQSLVEELCQNVMDLLDCQVFFNFLTDDARGMLHLNASLGIPDLEAQNIEWLEFGKAVCGCVARDGLRILAEDIRNLPDPRTELIASYGIQAYCCHPLKIQDRLIGTLSFGTSSRPRFRTEEVEVMRAVSDLVAIAMHRLQTEEALRTSEERFRLLVEQSPDGIFVADSRGHYVDVNTAGEQMLGYQRKEVLERSIGDMIAEEEIPRIPGEIAKLAHHSLTVSEWKFRRKDGTFFTGEVVARQLPDGRLQAILRDITERKKSEEALKASLREKEVLLKEIHHRVKNNMQVISSLASLQAGELQDASVHAALQDMSHRVRSMAMVHERLYESPDLSRVEFSAYARSLLDYLWRACRHPGPDIQFSLDMEPVFLAVDTAVPCGLVLNELAANALKHAFTGRERGTVTVSLRRQENGWMLLKVKDNGVGLPPGMDWKTPKSLGLRLVQMLARQLSGVLKVTIDGGAEFSMSFPLEKKGA